MEVEDADMDAPACVAARHFEDALASARRAVAAPAAQQHDADTDTKQGADNGGSGGWGNAGGEAMQMQMDGASGDADDAGLAVKSSGHGTGAGGTGGGQSLSDPARQEAFVRAAAARAANSIRAQFGGGGGAKTAQLKAYIVQLEARLQAAGIPLPPAAM